MDKYAGTGMVAPCCEVGLVAVFAIGIPTTARQIVRGANAFIGLDQLDSLRAHRPKINS